MKLRTYSSPPCIFPQDLLDTPRGENTGDEATSSRFHLTFLTTEQIQPGSFDSSEACGTASEPDRGHKGSTCGDGALSTPETTLHLISRSYLGGLHDLPTKILLQVTGYLLPSDLMSVSYSCRKIRQKLGISIEEVLGKKYRPIRLSRSELETYHLRRKLQHLARETNERVLNLKVRSLTSPVSQNPYHYARLNLLCLLDRDGLIPAGKFVCSGCVDTQVFTFLDAVTRAI